MANYPPYYPCLPFFLSGALAHASDVIGLNNIIFIENTYM